MSTAIEKLFPPGRMVMGSLYKPQDKDANGAPLVAKSGPNKGQPIVKYYFALAIPKKPGETHWAQTDWGAELWAFGHASWPQGQASGPDFAWKVEDGDSAIPNKKGRKNVETDGFAGHWIVNFSSGYAPQIVTVEGNPLLEKDAVKCGYYIEVLGSYDSNKNISNPGIYVNHKIVAMRGFGKELRAGVDPRSVGFGKAAAPAGATAAPVGSTMAPPAPTAPAGAPPPPAAAAPPAPPAPPAPAAPTTVVPHQNFMNTSAAPPPPPPPAAAPPPPPPAGPTWKGPAGSTYDGYKTAGWTDEQMRANGLLG